MVTLLCIKGTHFGKEFLNPRIVVMHPENLQAAKTRLLSYIHEMHCCLKEEKVPLCRDGNCGRCPGCGVMDDRDVVEIKELTVDTY